MSVRHLLLPALLALLLAAPGCPPSGDDDDSAGDDDDSAGDDDDATGDDDDATGDDDDATGDDDDATGDDDDATGDDDDATGPPECPATVQAQLADLGSWELRVSCGSAYLATSTADETLRVEVSFDLPLPVRAGDTWLLLFDSDDIPKNQVSGRVQLTEGQRLMTLACGDIIEPGTEPAEDHIWRALRGEASIAIEEHGEGDGSFFADISTSGIVVASEFDDSHRCTIPDTTWERLFLGWMPG